MKQKKEKNLCGWVMISGIVFSLSILVMDKTIAALQTQQTLSHYIEEEILTVDAALQRETSESTILSDSQSDEVYFFRRFWLRLRPRIERDIPGFAGLAVVPELEILFEKQTPEGWEIYRIGQR